MASTRLPPVWLLGLVNTPLGFAGGIALLVVPQLLAAAHVPEPRIAGITGLALMPTFIAFIVSPILDVRFSRRTYTVALAAASGLFCALALVAVQHLAIVGLLLFAATFGAQLSASAAGGWLAGLIPREDEGRLSAWMIVGSIGGFGVASVIGAPLIRTLPQPLGEIILGALVFAPVAAVVPFVPAPGPDRRLAQESFGRFAGDVAALLKQPSILQSLMLFVVPAASFALTNTLGGLGHDYGASEKFVSLIGGAGVIAGGVIGSLAVPPLAARVSPRPLYLGIGIAGALFTLALVVLPRTAGVFALAMVGENVFQAAGFATANAVIFRAIGKDNPFAATQFALLLAAQSLPVTYMQVIDGQAYGAEGLVGAYFADAGLGLAACACLAALLLVLRRRDPKVALAGAD